MIAAYGTLPALVLALPALRSGTPRGSYWRALAWSTFAITLPALFFLFSTVLTPDSKSAADHVWMASFQEGKLALAPAVAFAMGASWLRESWGLHDRPWLTAAHLVGALTSGFCFLFGVLAVPLWSEMGPFLIVPAISTALFAQRAHLLLRTAPLPLPGLAASLSGFLANLTAALVYSHQLYEALPEESHNCFVVTAASRGHRAVVGPLEPVERHGRPRLANRQLRTFWAFEDLWARRSPASHRAMRRLYGSVGPALARRMRHPLVADLVFVALKPLEWGAQRALRGPADADAPTPPPAAPRPPSSPPPA
jgi:hypothetical protein